MRIPGSLSLSLSLSLSPPLEKRVRGEVWGSQTLAGSNHPGLPYRANRTDHPAYHITRTIRPRHPRHQYQPGHPPGLPYRDDMHQPLRPTLSGRHAPTTPEYCIKPAHTVSACNKGNEDPSAHCSFRARRGRAKKSSFYFPGSFNDA